MFTSKPVRGRPALLFALVFLGGGTGAAPAGGPTPALLSWHKLILGGMIPGDVLRLIHWGETAAVTPSAAPVTLPEGVTRIYALAADNALLIQSTPDGFVRVREILQSLVVAPGGFSSKFSSSAPASPMSRRSGFTLRWTLFSTQPLSARKLSWPWQA